MTNYVLHENDINQFYFYCFLFWKRKQLMIGPIVQLFIISIFAVSEKRTLLSSEKVKRFVTSKIGVGFVCRMCQNVAKIALKSKPEALLQLGDFVWVFIQNQGKTGQYWTYPDSSKGEKIIREALL